MMKSRVKIIALLTIVALMAGADGAMQFDSIVKSGVGARALGMGGAFVAVADDSTAPHWNPAGLGWMEEKQIGFMHTNKHGLGLKYNFFDGILPLKNGNALALSLTRESLNDIPVIDETGTINQMTDNLEQSVMLSYGRQVNYRFSLGASIKSLSQRLYDANARGWELDLGILYRINDQLRFGMKAADINPGSVRWSTGNQDEIPWSLSTGVAYNSKGGAFITSLELGKTDKRDTEIRVGTEYRVNHLMSFRAGWDEGYTAGCSLSYNNWDFDYAWISRSLGDTNIISGTVYLDKIKSGIRKGWQRKETDMERRQARAELRRLPERREVHTDKPGKPMDVLQAYKEKESAKQMLEVEGFGKSAEDALKPENQAAETHYRLGNTFLTDGLYNKALEEYRAAVASDPSHVLAHFNLGAVYAKLQMVDKAIYEYTLVTQLDNRNLNAYLNLGDLYLQRGDKVESARHYNKIILLSPDSLNADVARDRLEKL